MDVMKKSRFIVGAITVLAMLSTGSVGATPTQFTVEVYLKSNGENVNALGGVLNYPRSWSVKDIRLEGPELLYWIEAPEVEDFGVLQFSAIFPGGVQNLEKTNELHLYAVDFWGDREDLDEMIFNEKEFYLNHPTALPATTADFTYKVTSNSFFKKISAENFFSNINYSFEKDPITSQNSLVVESYRGNLAAYDFFEKEGNFGSGEWLSVDGVQKLGSSSATVVLNVRTPEGHQYERVLRRSFVDQAIWAGLAGGGGLILFYLFYLAFKIFEFRPEDITKK